MEFSEFKTWLEKNAQGFEVFVIKATDLKIEKNKKRTGKTKKWSEKEIENQVNEMWMQVVSNAYQKVKIARKEAKAGMKTWEQFLEEMEFVESFDNSMHELELE